MDCIDCHNRPTHIYDMPDEVVDFGLLSKRINPEIEGIREDSLIALQKLRGEDQYEKNADDIEKAGAYLVESYMNNVWPAMNVTWGTYPSHLGHQRFDETGFGCWRCHDEEHTSEAGNYIKMDCDLCHDEPE